MYIPSYSKGLKVDWTKVIPIDSSNICMYLHPDVAIVFKDIWSEEKQRQFSISKEMENDKDIDCDDFNSRLTEFIPYKKARVKRVFEGKRESIFFDEEEVDILAAKFHNNKFTCIVEVYIAGKKKELSEMSDKEFKIVKPILDSYGVVENLTPKEFRNYKGEEKKDNKIILALGTLALGLLLGGGATYGYNRVKQQEIGK